MSDEPVIEIYPGEDVIRDVVVYADLAQTTRLDLTGTTITHKIYTAPGREEIYSGITTITDAANGEVTTALPPGATDTWGKKVLYAQTYMKHPDFSRVIDEYKLRVG